MNKYRRLVVKFKDAKERFNRELYVKEDLTLYEVGCVIGEAFDVSFTHYFLFEDKQREYVTKEWVEEIPYDAVDYKTATLNDLILPKSNTFTYEYDTGDCWDFSCKLDPKVYELDNDADAFCTKAVGQGIWEDRSELFREYVSGDISEETLEWYGYDREDVDVLIETFEEEVELELLNDCLYEIRGMYDDIYEPYDFDDFDLSIDEDEIVQ